MSQFPDRNGLPIGRTPRVLLVLWGLFLLMGFSLAIYLEPDSRGFGTHQRLGLPPCTFRQMFTIPCPSCGMTTSFAHFVRGQIVSSARANFAGLLLAAFCLVMIPWSWISAYKGRTWKLAKPEMGLFWVLVSIFGICLINWGIRLLWG